MGRFGRFRLPDGKVVEAVDLEVSGPDVQTLRFPLSDGAIIEVRIEVTVPQRSKDEKDSLGFPLYNVNLQVKTRTVNVPEELLGAPGAPVVSRAGADIDDRMYG